jgi:hypothetical protein
MIDLNRGSNLILIAIIIGLCGFVVAQYMTYSERLSHLESDVVNSDERLRELEQYRAQEHAQLSYWFARRNVGQGQDQRFVNVHIRNTGTVNFIITDLMIDGTQYPLTDLLMNGGRNPTLIRADASWQTFPVQFDWVEPRDGELADYQIQIITHRGNLFEIIAQPTPDRYWVSPEE